METSDKKQFAITLTMLAENFSSKALSKELATMWFRYASSAGITIEDWVKACGLIIRHRAQRGMPTYAEIVEAFYGKLEDKAEIMAGKIFQAIKGGAPEGLNGDSVAIAIYHNELFRFENLLVKDEGFFRRDLRAAYIARTRNGVIERTQIVATGKVRKLTAGIG